VRKKFRHTSDHTTDMLKIIDKELLPKDFGGTGAQIVPSK
jgi:hypothetical protein